MAVTERELLDLKKVVSEARDNIIKARATMQEVEKNMRSAATELRGLGIDVALPVGGDPDEWDAFYTDLLAAAVMNIADKEADLTAQLARLKALAATWQK